MVPTIFDINIGISVKSLSDWQWLLRFRNILQIHVTSCSDRLWRWFWAQITLEFHGGFGYHTGISKLQLNNPQNIEKCSRTNREIEMLLFREDIGVVDHRAFSVSRSCYRRINHNNRRWRDPPPYGITNLYRTSIWDGLRCCCYSNSTIIERFRRVLTHI